MGKKTNVKMKNEINVTNVNIKIYTNMVFAVLSMLFFASLNLVYLNCTEEVFKIYIKVSYMMYLFITIFILEIAYKKDSDTLAIYGIENMAIAIYILIMERIVDLLNIQMHGFIVFSSYIFPIYYTFKSIIIDTLDRKHELEKLSDIKDIVKEEKPSKKLAKKRKK